MSKLGLVVGVGLAVTAVLYIVSKSLLIWEIMPYAVTLNVFCLIGALVMVRYYSK